MEIPRNIITSLGNEVMKVMRQVDLLIDTYEHQGRDTKEMDLYSVDFDKVNKKLLPKYDLKTDTYRGFKINRKLKPRRHNKRKLQEIEYDDGTHRV